MTWLEPTDIVVVTGGSGGLGASILREFALKGCQTVSLDITPVITEESDEKSDKVDEKAAKDPNPETSDNTGSLSVSSAQENSPHDSTNSKNNTVATNNSQQTSTKDPDGNSTSNSSASSDKKSTPGISLSEEVESTNTGRSENEEGNLKPTLCIQCDVRDVADLEKAQALIFSKFKRSPSVLVLNAAIRSPLNSIADSSYEELDATIDVNLSGVLKCLRTFLPEFISNKRGFIVTIASALGIVVPKGLGTYGASKAALIGLHESLTQELAEYSGVKALLVCPGQLDTKMFSDVATPSEYLAPIVSPEKLAKKIVKRVKRANTSTVYSPNYVRYLPIVNALPVCFARLARKMSGVDKVYDDIVASRVHELDRNTDSSDDTADLVLSHEEAEILSSSDNLPELSRSLSGPSETTRCHTTVENICDLPKQIHD